MKKVKYLIFAVVSVFLFGSTTVNAEESYWKSYFNELGSIPAANFDCGLNCGVGGSHKWVDHSYKFAISDRAGGGLGAIPDELAFSPAWYTENELYFDMSSSNVTSTSDNSKVLEAKVTDYTFSKEEEKFNKYVSWFEGLSLEEFNELKGGEPVKVKPTWWEYTNKSRIEENKYKSEPQNWWEAYGYQEKPTAIEVSYQVHDFGKAKITLNSTSKGKIEVDWIIGVRDFIPFPVVVQKQLKNKSQGLVEVLNNLSKYKGYYPERNEQQKYNFSYEIEKNEDLSAIINTLKGKDITVKFYSNSNGIYGEYYLNGNDIKTTVGKGFTYDYNISMTDSVNKDKIESLVDLENALFIDFAYHGSLPAKFNLSVNIDSFLRSKFVEQGICKSGEAYSDFCNNKVTEFLDGNNFTLLYYNPDTNKMEVIKENLKPNDQGVFDLEFDHFSSYVLVRSDNYKAVSMSNNQESNNAQTSSINILLYSILSICSLGGIIYILIKKKKNLRNEG